MLLTQLVRRTAHTVRPAGADCDIAAVTYDSRRAAPGALFVCLVGAWQDGHTFAPSAYENGARAFLVERWLELPADAVQVRVQDTRAALAVLAAAFYGDPAEKLHLIGITGTKGKTTTALLTAAVLTAAGLPCAYIGSNGADIAGKHYHTANTTPESLVLQKFFREMLDAGVRHCVLEVSSQALAHHRVDGLPFEVVAFTNLSEDHIGPGEHPDFEDYKNAKRRLFSDYSARRMVYNADDAASDFMRAGFAGEQVSFGIEHAADYRAADLRSFRDDTSLGVEFSCGHAGRADAVRVLSPGAFSASDALCALALAGSFGVTPAAAAPTLAVTPVQGRFEVVPGLPGRTFIVDYSHNGLALSSALATLRAYHPARLVCIFGSVGDRTQVRRRELAEAAGAGADLSILTSDNPGHEDPEHILDDIAAHMPAGAPFLRVADRAEAIRRAVELSRPGDILLFAGKGHEDYQLIGDEKVPFCERGLIQEACRHFAAR